MTIELSTSTWLNLAAGFRELGQYEDALTLVAEELRRRPRNAEAWHRRGSYLVLSRQDAEAEGAFRNALRCDQRHSGARFNLATLLRCQSPGEALYHLIVLRRDSPDLATLLEGQLQGLRER